MPKLDLLVSKEDLRACRLIDSLSAPLERIDRRLAQNMASANSEAVGYLAHGAFGDDTSKKGRAVAEDATLRRNLEILTQSTAGGLTADLAFDPVVQRMEAVLHPRMLVRKGAGRDLPALVVESHRRCALVVEPTLGLDREGSEPAQLIRDLLPLLDGTVSRTHARRREHLHGEFESARAQLILTPGLQEREVMAGAGSALLDRVLWLCGDENKHTIPLKTDDSAKFYDAYQSSLEEIVELRREGHSLMACFESVELRGRFHEALRAYETEVTAMKSRPGNTVVGLPVTLSWGMWFLRR